MVYDFFVDRKYVFSKEDRQRKEALFGKGKPGRLAGAISKAVFIDMAASGVLGRCGASRRASHLFSLWGFVAVLLGLLWGALYPSTSFSLSIYDPVISLTLVGSIFLLVGSLWYLPQRANVSYEGDSIFRITYADAFLFNLIAISLFGIATWGFSALGYYFYSEAFFVLLLASLEAMVLLAHWTKFPHVFYKAGVFVLDRVDEARGVHTLPEPQLEG